MLDKKKLTLDARAYEMKLRHSMKLSNRISSSEADPEVCTKRFQVLCDSLEMSNIDIADLLGLSRHSLPRIRDGSRKCPLYLLKLAEIEIGKVIRRQKRGLPSKKAMYKVPSVLKKDKGLKSKIVQMHITGKTREEICRHFAMRPEIIDFFLQDISDD